MGVGIGVGVGNELVEGEDGFAEAAVADPDVKALARVVEGALVFPQGREVHLQGLRSVIWMVRVWLSPLPTSTTSTGLP